MLDVNVVSRDVQEPLVSILIPAFNAQEWIADTLRSAIAQTWQRKEIIVVDDGSTDRTAEIARRFEPEGVRVVTQKNQGAAAARNKAFSLSRGDYIQWLDADDLLAPDKIARQMAVMEQGRSKKTLLSSSWGRFHYRSSRAVFIPTALWCDLSPVEWLLRKMGQNLYMLPITWLASRELTEAAGPWDTRLLSDDDGEYFCRVLLASDGVRFVPEAKAHYRGPGLAFRSLSYIGQSARKLDAHWISMRLHIGYLRSLEDSERVRTACLRYLEASLIYFYPEMPDVVRQAEQLARELGGQLNPPHLSWKYIWIKVIFGWRIAKRTQQLLLRFRWLVETRWDKELRRIEKTMVGSHGGPGTENPQPVDACLDLAGRRHNGQTGMASLSPWGRVISYYRRRSAGFLFRRPFLINTRVPFISFTFDDFPRSALHTGGAILKRFGLAGTYYASFGLMGKQAPTGTMFLREDLNTLLEQGHELGCHTFSHCDSWETKPHVFEDSIIQNRLALTGLFPGASFRTFSYPISPPRHLTKVKVAHHFQCCRGGSQTLNIGTVDLNQLSAYFLEKSRDRIQSVKDLIDHNRQVRGWLIFATHDISERPTPYGCTPEFFEEVVQYAVSSGACILPVARALEALRSSRNDSTNVCRTWPPMRSLTVFLSMLSR